MAHRRSLQLYFLLVIFLVVASFVYCDDSSDSDSAGIIGFRVRISRWIMISKVPAIDEEADRQGGLAEKTTSENSGAATILWSPQPPVQIERDEEEAPKLDANDMALAIRPIETFLGPERASSDEHDKQWDHGHGCKHKHGDHDAKWQRRLKACRTDTQRFCLSEDGLEDLLLCLSQREAQLSPQCSAELSSSAIFQCAADAARFCSNEYQTVSDNSLHEKRHIISCLESNYNWLSGKCINAINDRRMRHGKGALEQTDYSGQADDERTPHGHPHPHPRPNPYPVEDGYGSGSGYEMPRPSRRPRPPRPTPAPGDSDSSDYQGVTGVYVSSNSNALPQWALIALVGISAAFVFMAALTVILLLQHKRRRQREAVLEAANSLSLPPPPPDVQSGQTVRLTQFEMPYHRLDEVQLV